MDTPSEKSPNKSGNASHLGKMVVIRGYRNLSQSLAHPVVTLGNFDGVHLGHQQIIKQAIEQAKARHGTSVAYTFKPHPRIALSADQSVPLLTTYDEKLEILAGLGIDLVVEEPFSREFSTIDPERFLSEALVDQLKAEAIVVGYDFAFGRERAGHLELLASFCRKHAIQLTIVPPQTLPGGETISSSKIRQRLSDGQVEQANRLLGREFYYRGIVIRGDGRGHKIGFPTANLRPENKIVLPYGVYATWAILGDRKFESVTNIGVRPTFQSEGASELPALVESHLLDQDIDLYGSVLEVRFIRRLRDEKKFESIEALKTQISHDVGAARTIFRGLSSQAPFVNVT